MEAVIHRALFTRNPCAAKPVTLKPRGIMVHSVGCKGTDFTRWQKWDVPGATKCVHFFLDGQGIHQALPEDVRAWHCGGSGNNSCLSMELCEPWTDTPANAEALFRLTTALCTQLCRTHGLTSDSILSHAEGHARGMASNHGDPDTWWRSSAPWREAGYTMDALRRAVSQALESPVKEDGMTELYQVGLLPPGDPGLNLRDAPNGSRVLAVLPQGEHVTPTGRRSGGWVEAVSRNTTGWVWGVYLVPSGGDRVAISLLRDTAAALSAALKEAGV